MMAQVQVSNSGSGGDSSLESHAYAMALKNLMHMD